MEIVSLGNIFSETKLYFISISFDEWRWHDRQKMYIIQFSKTFTDNRFFDLQLFSITQYLPLTSTTSYLVCFFVFFADAKRDIVVRTEDLSISISRIIGLYHHNMRFHIIFSSFYNATIYDTAWKRAALDQNLFAIF